MSSPFSKIGLAVTFSPNGFALLKEAIRFKELFNANICLIHVGKKNPGTEEKLNNIIVKAGQDPEKIEVIWDDGEPASVILKASKKAGVDLLICGALEKENLLKYYIGSVARTIMREADCSVLILKAPSENPHSFKKFYISADYSIGSEKTLRKAHQFALLENASDFVIVKDYNIPGLASTVLDSGSSQKLDEMKTAIQREEEEKMNFFIRDLNLKGLNMRIYCLYGREGFETNNFARENKADIFIVTGPSRKQRLIDRLFPHEQEYSFANLPSNLLIIR